MQLKDFPLAWRWTDARYAVLPNEALQQITPYSASQAAVLFKKGLEFCAENGLNETLYRLEQLETGKANTELVTGWLLSRHSDLNTKVNVSWQPDTAVSTTWGIFANFWSEFCYPASDDLLLWPQGSSWVLLYHHEEIIQYGVRIEHAAPHCHLRCR